MFSSRIAADRLTGKPPAGVVFARRGMAERILFHALGWTLLCLSLREAVPAAWAWTALPIAVIFGVAADLSGLRTLTAALALIAAPLLIRLAILAISAAAGSDFIVALDNGWVLTAPYWYFTAAAMLFVRRRPALGYAEAAVLALFCGIVLARDDDWRAAFSAPATAAIKLVCAAAVLVLTALCFAASRRGSAAQKAGMGPPPFRRPDSSDIAHYIILAAALALLFFAGNKMRRESSLSSGGGVLASDLFHFDFNDVLSLEPEISMNGELTMLYREDGPAVQRYLRRYTLSGWNPQRGFFRDGEREKDFPERDAMPVSLPKGPMEWPHAGFETREQVHQEYYLVALDPNSFFALDYPVSVEPWVIWDDASFVRAYAVESRVSIADLWDLYGARTSGMAEPDRSYYLEGGDDPYFISLAEKVVGENKTPWSKAAAIEKWFHKEFYYSLKPGLAADGDQLSLFLKETHRGYCSYFAFAMTRLCRAAGIPARVAVGFVTDPSVSTLGFVPVRADQAHAWVEVWLDDHGWITFDPTTDTMAPGEEYPIQFISPDEWLPLIEEALTRRGEVSVALDEEDDTEENGGFWNSVVRLVRHRPVLAWIIVILIPAALYAPGRIVPGLIYAVAAHSRNSRKRVKARWKMFARRLIRSGNAPFASETPADWAARVWTSFASAGAANPRTENSARAAAELVPDTKTSTVPNAGPHAGPNADPHAPDQVPSASPGGSAGLSGFEDWTALYLKAVFSPVFSKQDSEVADSAAETVRASWKKQPRSVRLRSALGLGWLGGLPW